MGGGVDQDMRLWNSIYSQIFKCARLMMSLFSWILAEGK